MRHQLRIVKSLLGITLRLKYIKLNFSMPKFYNVVTRKTLNKPINDKHIYHKVGVIKITENGGWFLQLYQQPNTDFMIFPNHKDNLPVIDFGSHETE